MCLQTPLRLPIRDSHNPIQKADYNILRGFRYPHALEGWQCLILLDFYPFNRSLFLALKIAMCANTKDKTQTISTFQSRKKAEAAITPAMLPIPGKITVPVKKPPKTVMRYAVHMEMAKPRSLGFPINRENIQPRNPP